MGIQYLHEFLQTSSPDGPFWDLMMIGSGPVGLTLAAEFEGTSARVLVIESGGLHQTSGVDDLNDFESVGAPRVTDPALLRARTLGGTSAIWSGRCSPLDEIDLEERPWVPFSGWPSDVVQTHDAYLDRASAHLGLGPHPYDGRLWHELRRRAPQFNPARLRSHFWQYSRDRERPLEYTRFGPRFLQRAAGNVDILLGATVTKLNTGANRRSFASVEVATPDGQRGVVRAKRAVLCAGGIENPRLLLNLFRSSEQNGTPPLEATGRFLMDHPRCTIGHFSVRDAVPVARFFGVHLIRTSSASRSFTHGVALSTAMQRGEGLLNCAAWLTEARAKDDPWEALKRLRVEGRPRVADLAAIAGNLPSLARGAYRHFLRRRGVLHRCSALNLDCLVEQVPDPQSRVVLAAGRDRFDVPLARIDWRVGALEKATVARFGSIIVKELQRLGGPPLQLAEWIRDRDTSRGEMIDVAHPMGTTRMSTDPRLGVVDHACQVHGIENLFVAGSSIFPTAGHANPTLMALMMTVRLADHIKAMA